MPHRILITGAAGYIGAMLCERLSELEDIEAIIGLDAKPMPELLRGNAKVTWIAANTIETGWREIAAAARPNVVIHAAWLIRQPYVRANSINIVGSDAVFDFALNAPSVRKLIHFSTVSGYGARAGNTTVYRFTEDAPFLPSDFTYAEEKRIVERHLEEKFAQSGNGKQVVVLRPAAVTGPRGRSRSSLFGMQAALNGTLGGSFTARLVSLALNFIPVTADWCRQFVHEDDLTGVVTLLVVRGLATAYSRFNVSPPGQPMTGADIAAAFRKRLIRVHPQLIRFAFFLAWHASRGRIPTPRGAWKSYCYPIVVDGSAVTTVHGYNYRYGTKDAFTEHAGHYAKASAAVL